MAIPALAQKSNIVVAGNMSGVDVFYADYLRLHRQHGLHKAMACLQHEDVWTLCATGGLCDSAQPMGFANLALGQGKAVLAVALRGLTYG